MTASNPRHAPADQTREKQQRDSDCRPMSHQNSGGHGYEIYPQQFVRLVGCHDVHAPAARRKEDSKLH